MDPKIVEQVSSEIAKNLNGITDSVVNISKSALEQYVHAQYVFGFILAGVSLLLFLCLGINLKLMRKFATQGDEGEIRLGLSVTVLAIIMLITVIVVSSSLQSFYNAMSPVTVLVLGK